MSYDKRMKILSKLDSIDPAEALTAYPRIAEYDAITKLPICRRRGKNNMSMKRLQIFFGFNCRPIIINLYIVLLQTVDSHLYR